MKVSRRMKRKREYLLVGGGDKCETVVAVVVTELEVAQSLAYKTWPHILRGGHISNRPLKVCKPIKERCSINQSGLKGRRSH